MWSARRPPARVSGPAARTNDIDTDERRQIIPQRGRPTTNHQQGVDKRCLMPHSWRDSPKDHVPTQRLTSPSTGRVVKAILFDTFGTVVDSLPVTIR